jgi:probable phosphoglycerate mutase
VRLILVRHGAVQPPRPQTFYGGSEVPLSELGRAEAEAAATALRGQILHHVACSPLSRAHFGAERIVAGRDLPAAPEICEGLREIDRGRWLGSTLAEIQQRWPGDWAAHHADPAGWRGHGGESLADLQDRVLGVRDRLQREWTGATVALVAHLYPIRALVAAAHGTGMESWEGIRIPTGSITLCEWGGDRWRVSCLAQLPQPGAVLPGFSTAFSTDVPTFGLNRG